MITDKKRAYEASDPCLEGGTQLWNENMRSVRDASEGQTHHLAEASCVDNAYDACRAMTCTYPVGVDPFQASLAAKKVRTPEM